MTKPANFPERRRQRQISALKRLSEPMAWMEKSRLITLAHERKVLSEAAGAGSQIGKRTKRGLRRAAA